MIIIIKIVGPDAPDYVQYIQSQSSNCAVIYRSYLYLCHYRNKKIKKRNE